MSASCGNISGSYPASAACPCCLAAARRSGRAFYAKRLPNICAEARRSLNGRRIHARNPLEEPAHPSIRGMDDMVLGFVGRIVRQRLRIIATRYSLPDLGGLPATAWSLRKSAMVLKSGISCRNRPMTSRLRPHSVASVFSAIFELQKTPSDAIITC